MRGFRRPGGLGRRAVVSPAGKRTLQSLDGMLDQAICGEFSPTKFDESLFSAVESRLADYLEASAVSARNLQAEKDAIKTLIGDISHQTKTPIANLLLYAQLLGEQPLPPRAATVPRPWRDRRRN